MADDIAVTAGAGTTVATDDVGGRHFQRVKATWGADGTATDVAAGGSGLPTAPDYLEVTGSVTSAASMIASTDVRPYGWVSLQITTAGSGTVTFQGSNDGTTWKSALLLDVGATVSTVPVSTATAVGHFHGPMRWRYFRAQVTSYTSGTFAATAEFMSAPSQWGIVPVTVGNSVTVGSAPTTAVTQSGTWNAFCLGLAVGATDLSSSARTVSGVGSFRNIDGYRSLGYYVNVTAVSGTSPTLDIKLQGNWGGGPTFDIPGASLAQITAIGSYELAIAPGITPVTNRRVADVLPQRFATSYTIGGTTPSFTFSSGYFVAG